MPSGSIHLLEQTATLEYSPPDWKSWPNSLIIATNPLRQRDLTATATSLLKMACVQEPCLVQDPPKHPIMRTRDKTRGKGKSRSSLSEQPESSSSVPATTPYTTAGLPSPETEEEIASKLQWISESLADAMNTRNVYNHWTTQFFAEDLNFTPLHRGPWHGKRAVLEGLRQFLDKYPHYRQEVTDSSCNVNLKADYADVHVSYNATGTAPGMILQNMVVTDWRLRAGKWFMVKVFGMRANPLLSSQPGSPENTPAGSPEQR